MVQGAPTARDTPSKATLSPTALAVAERRNHARELVRAEELGRWDALVVMSGDGLIHEVRPVPGAWVRVGGPGRGVPRLRPPCSPRW